MLRFKFKLLFTLVSALLFALILGRATAQETSVITADKLPRLNPVAIMAGDGATGVLGLRFSAYAENLIVRYTDGSSAAWANRSWENPSYQQAEQLALHPEAPAAYSEAEGVYTDAGLLFSLEEPVSDLLYSPDGALLVAAGVDGSISVWDVAAGALRATLTGYEGAPTELIFSSDGRILASRNPAANQIRLWDSQSGSNRQVILPSSGLVRFSPDNTQVAFLRDDNSVLLSDLAGILNEAAQRQSLTLSGHYARITDMAFSSDGSRLATASADGTLSLWDTSNGAGLAVLMGHEDSVTALAFSPEGDLIASASRDKSIRLWDGRDGSALHSLEDLAAAPQHIAFPPDGRVLISADAAGNVIVWGVDGATDQQATPFDFNTQASLTNTALAPSDGLLASARQKLSAGSHPLHPVGCFIAQDELMLIVGRSAEGAYLVYAGGESCEGLVWTAPAFGLINWINAPALADLPIIDPGQTEPLHRLPAEAHAELCQNARAGGALPTGTAYAYPPDHLPSQAQASLSTGLDALICHEYVEVTIENCHYLGPRNYSYIFIRKRTDDILRLVDPSDGRIMAQRRFEGAPPPFCPDSVTRGEVAGDPPAPDLWMAWVLGNLNQPNMTPLRTRISPRSVDARTEPKSDAEVMGNLDAQTPLNLIGRNANADWVLALTPEMAQVWLPASAIQPAAQVDFASLPLSDAVFVVEQRPERSSLDLLFGYLAKMRPLGRFEIEAEYITLSADGFRIAGVRRVMESSAPRAETISIEAESAPTSSSSGSRSLSVGRFGTISSIEDLYALYGDDAFWEYLETLSDDELDTMLSAIFAWEDAYYEAQQGQPSQPSQPAAEIELEERLYLSVWDIRGGDLIWQVALPDRTFQAFGFSPDGTTLLVQTDSAHEDDPEEIRLTFYAADTGEVVSRTGDINIIDAPIIPGNIPQPLQAQPQYTKPSNEVVISYWRRAEAPRCAVWDVEAGSILWEQTTRCGMVNPAGRYMIVPQRFEEINSAYSQLLIYEVMSGALVAASSDEVMGYRWLDDQRIIIHRPYGEPSVIWDMQTDDRAVIETPIFLGEFYPTVLKQVMFYAHNGVTYAWDKASGALLGETDLQGRLVEQDGRVLILQNDGNFNQHQARSNPNYLLEVIATDLESKREAWRVRWVHSPLTIREDGAFGYAYNYETQIVDIFDLGNGEVIGAIPVSGYNFAFTADWQWLIQAHQGRFTIWGAEESLSLFANPPHVLVLEDQPIYYNPSLSEEIPYSFIRAGRFLWLASRNPDGDWVKVADAYGGDYWIPTDHLALEVSLEDIPLDSLFEN